MGPLEEEILTINLSAVSEVGGPTYDNFTA
jgi:hypothetical protein